jgi:tetratricopeptide (TPR) repeat protein
MVIGTALFYSFFKKKITALNTIENYLRVGKPSLKLLGLYLHILVKTGKLEKAANAYNKLLPAKKNWGIEIFLYASEYFDLNQDFKAGEKVLSEGIQKFPSHVSLRLSILKYYLRNKRINSFEKTLGFVRKRDAEKSPVYYASFLENMGLRAILRGNEHKVKAKKDFYFKKSAIYFNKALKIKESPSLRSKLARLAVGGEDIVKELIIKSKIYDFMKRSEEAMKKKKWGEALTLGVKAVDLSESFIPPHLLLAKIQIKRGYHASGITRLEDLKELHSKDLKVNHALIDAYINSYKLDKAKSELDVLLNKREFQEFVNASEYPALLANYYLKKGDIQSAIKNLNESIKREPLNDENIFKLAKIYLSLRKYPRARINLSKAIELDPLNVDYKVVWAKILYELESSDLAIGYLRDLLKEHPDDPKILADIAIYYYKSGQLNEFEDQKQKIEKMAQADPSFYVFLIKSAQIEEKPEDVIRYANQLLKIYPGNLEIRMLLAELYFKRKEYKRSLKEFKELKEWLPSYPKVNYFLAKGFLAAGNFKKASDYAKEESELNPSSEYGFVIAGEIFNFEREKTRDRTKILQLARKSIKSFEKAIRLNPKSVEALIGLGKLKLGQGKNNEAVDLFKRANKEDLSNAAVYKLLGEAYTARGELGFAIESYKSYLEVNKLASDKEQIQEMIKKLK